MEKDVVHIYYIYIIEYYSVIKKNKVMPFAATWMNLEIIILNEVHQTEKDKYHMILLTRGLLKKNIQMNVSKNQNPIYRVNMITRGEGRGGRIYWDFGIDMYTMIYVKEITNRNLLYTTRNSDIL